MATAISGGGRIRNNTAADNAYNSLMIANQTIAEKQLRLSTGKRINSAADDVAGYITSRALGARTSSLKNALNAVGEARNVTSMALDSLDNVGNLLNKIKDATAMASTGALGSDEKVALAKTAYRLTQQIQSIVDTTVFGGRQLLGGTYSGDWTIGYKSDDSAEQISLNLREDAKTEYNITDSGVKFNLNATSDVKSQNTFAGVSGLSMNSLNSITTSDLGIFAETAIGATLTSLADAINNIAKVSAYIGGIDNRLSSQEELLTSQITNYKAATSRIEDADAANEQMELMKFQFLQQASLISSTQANQAPQAMMQLFR